MILYHWPWFLLWDIFVAGFCFWVGSAMAANRWWPWRKKRRP